MWLFTKDTKGSKRKTVRILIKFSKFAKDKFNVKSQLYFNKQKHTYVHIKHIICKIISIQDIIREFQHFLKDFNKRPK